VFPQNELVGSSTSVRGEEDTVHAMSRPKVVGNRTTRPALVTALRVGEIDLAISALPGVMPEDLRSLPLIDDDLCLVVRDDHPLLRKRRLRLQDLADAEWLLPGSGVAARRSIEGRFAEAGLPPPRVAVEVSNTGGAQLNQMVVHSDLISIMSESIIGTPTGNGLSPLPMADARLTRTIGALMRKGPPLPPLAERLLGLLQSARPVRTASARRFARGA
jgi:DNA-binding transcriptional LysR family regulator